MAAAEKKIIPHFRSCGSATISILNKKYQTLAELSMGHREQRCHLKLDISWVLQFE